MIILPVGYGKPAFPPREFDYGSGGLKSNAIDRGIRDNYPDLFDRLGKTRRKP